MRAAPQGKKTIRSIMVLQSATVLFLIVGPLTHYGLWVHLYVTLFGWDAWHHEVEKHGAQLFSYSAWATPGYIVLGLGLLRIRTPMGLFVLLIMTIGLTVENLLLYAQNARKRGFSIWRVARPNLQIRESQSVSNSTPTFYIDGTHA